MQANGSLEPVLGPVQFMTEMMDLVGPARSLPALAAEWRPAFERTSLRLLPSPSRGQIHLYGFLLRFLLRFLRFVHDVTARLFIEATVASGNIEVRF